MDFNPKANVIMVDYWERRRSPVVRKNLDIAKEAIENIQKFYPDFQFILVTDYPENSELNKVRHIRNLKLVHIPGLGNYPDALIHGGGHGIGLDEGVFHVKTEYFYTVDRDILIKKPGWPELLAGYLKDKTCAVGKGFSNCGTALWNSLPFVCPRFAIYKTEPIKKFHLSFYQGGFMGNKKIGGLPTSTGQLLCYLLLSLGLNYIDIGGFDHHIKHRTETH